MSISVRWFCLENQTLYGSSVVRSIARSSRSEAGEKVPRVEEVKRASDLGLPRGWLIPTDHLHGLSILRGGARTGPGDAPVRLGVRSAMVQYLLRMARYSTEVLW